MLGYGAIAFYTFCCVSSRVRLFSCGGKLFWKTYQRINTQRFGWSWKIIDVPRKRLIALIVCAVSTWNVFGTDDHSQQYNHSVGTSAVSAVAVLQRRTKSFGFGQEERNSVDRKRASQRELDGKQLRDDQRLAAKHLVTLIPIHQRSGLDVPSAKITILR